MEKWEINFDLISEWLDEIDERTYEQIVSALRVLERLGPQLGRPLVDTIKASRFKNMKELRPGSSGSTEIRILFAFDPQRKAILLIAGDKQRKWTKWYKENIPKADDLFEKHLKTILGEF